MIVTYINLYRHKKRKRWCESDSGDKLGMLVKVDAISRLEGPGGEKLCSTVAAKSVLEWRTPSEGCMRESMKGWGGGGREWGRRGREGRVLGETGRQQCAWERGDCMRVGQGGGYEEKGVEDRKWVEADGDSTIRKGERR